ncbi:50S ribosomal protein L28 [Buchnera aphidicola]|uniref:50S ribosomal protein L28 n=1 Tax=Buchnera aphidicola TaxID=9 RepID=UPI00094C6338|nr:50S ribosomal protein L28 [Buchnera aphidicola]
MPKKCQITKKKSMLGQNRSHAMNATKRKFSLNIQYHKFWLPDENKRIKIRISSKGLRMINKFGISKIYKQFIV